MEEREKVEQKLEELIRVYGAENMLWTVARTLSTDRLTDLVNDFKWAIGE